ncbi:MAG: 23S rRNA (guanosine(2251)-2'-O)-methyltransferase RlmB [bacterium]
MGKIYGRIPVLEALKAGVNLQTVFLAIGIKGQVIDDIQKQAKINNIPVSYISQTKMETVLGKVNSQGVYAVQTEMNFSSVDEILINAKKKKYPLILILDSIQDPHNLGAILRTAEACGVDGVFLTTHNSAKINETVEKTSAGAVFHLKICNVANINPIIKELKKEGYWIFGSMLDNKSKNYTEHDYKLPAAIVLGNEGKGMHRLTAENCDFLVKIPMMGKIESLNVSVSTGVLLYEVLRQRNS